ncbi:unnamed protein product [Didymodactylos carnosus]|uniref:ADP ribosyltransferase domain-containing protein n=1 Tax=Didymodactylos carnosus TaxID=1234261 RepID=A0A8S2K7X5_9BILA|nr:unnamed protein product [Didymodactylos carnosus]CAF3840118.1 unnamed protein product [Didymodactylos carnosus]
MDRQWNSIENDNDENYQGKDCLPLKIFDGTKTSINDLTEASITYMWLRRIKEIFLAMSKRRDDDPFVEHDLVIAKEDMHQTCTRYIESIRPTSNILNENVTPQDADECSVQKIQAQIKKLSEAVNKVTHDSSTDTDVNEIKDNISSLQHTIKKLKRMLDNLSANVDQKNTTTLQTIVQKLEKKSQKTSLQLRQDWSLQKLYAELFKMSYSRSSTSLEIKGLQKNNSTWVLMDVIKVLLITMIETIFSDTKKTNQKGITLYRADKVNKSSFEKMEQKQKGQLITMNGFVSTTTDISIAEGYARNQFVPPGAISVLFEIKYNPKKQCTAFADIEDISFHPEEKEVLFSMGSAFAIDRVDAPLPGESFYRIKLTASDLDKSIVSDMKSKVEQSSSSGLSMLLARYLIELGEYRAVKKYLNSLLNCDILMDDPSIASAFNCMGMIYSRQGLYADALKYFKQALNHQTRLEYSNNNALAEIHNNIGEAYVNLSYFDEALEVFNEAKRTQMREPLSTRQHLASIHSNIGYAYYKKKDFDDAEKSFTTADELYSSKTTRKLAYDALEQRLMEADLNLKYGNLLSVKQQFEKADEQYDKAIKMYQTLLTETDPKLMKAHTDCIVEYTRTRAYTKVIEKYKNGLSDLLHKYESKAFEVTTTTDLKILTNLYYLIGACYAATEKYDEAIQSWKSGYICKRKNHIDQLLRATSDDDANDEDLSLLYFIHKSFRKVSETKTKDKGLVYFLSEQYEKAKIELEQTKNSDPIDRVLLADLYTQLNLHDLAIENYENAVSRMNVTKTDPIVTEIYLSVAQSETGLEKLQEHEKYFRINESDNRTKCCSAFLYAKARSIAEQSIALKSQNFSQYHPSIATSYSLIAETYLGENNYKQAIEMYQKTIEIQQLNLPMDHRDIKQSYSKMGNIFCKMYKLNDAIEKYQFAIEDGASSLLNAIMYSTKAELLAEQKDYWSAGDEEMKSRTILVEQLPKDLVDIAEATFMDTSLDDLKLLINNRVQLSDIRSFATFLADLSYIYLKEGYIKFKQSSVECEMMYQEALNLQLKITLFQNSDEDVTTKIYQTLGFVNAANDINDEALRNYYHAMDNDSNYVIHWKLVNLYEEQERYSVALSHCKHLLRYTEMIQDTQNVIKNKFEFLTNKGKAEGSDEEENFDVDRESSDGESVSSADSPAKDTHFINSNDRFLSPNLSLANTYYLLQDYPRALDYYQKDIEHRTKKLSQKPLLIKCKVDSDNMWLFLIELFTKQISQIKQSKRIDSYESMTYEFIGDLYTKCAEIAVKITTYSDAVYSYANALQLYTNYCFEQNSKTVSILNRLSHKGVLSVTDITKFYENIPDVNREYKTWIKLKMILLEHELAKDIDEYERIIQMCFTCKQDLDLSNHSDLMIDAALNYVILKICKEKYGYDDGMEIINKLKINEQNLPIYDVIVLYRMMVDFIVEFADKNYDSIDNEEVEQDEDGNDNDEDLETVEKYQKLLFQQISKAVTPVLTKDSRMFQTFLVDDNTDDKSVFSCIGDILTNIGAYNLAAAYWENIRWEKEQMLSTPILNIILSKQSNVPLIYNEMKRMEIDLAKCLTSIAQSYDKYGGFCEKYGDELRQNQSGQEDDIAAVEWYTHTKAVFDIADSLYKILGIKVNESHRNLLEKKIHAGSELIIAEDNSEEHAIF